MNTTDIEKLQLIPKKSQLTPPEGDCKLARINEVEGGETTPTTSPLPNPKSLEEFLFIETPSDAHIPSTSSFVSSRPATAGPAPRSTHVERISTAPSSSTFYKDSPSISPFHRPINSNASNAENRYPIYHSDTNIATLATPSPIIIRTSCQTDENSTEIVHPPPQGPNTHLNIRVKDRGISASLDDLQDVSFCLALENSRRSDNTDFLNPNTSMKKPFMFRTVSDSTEEGPISDMEMKRLGEKGAVASYRKKSRCHCCGDEMPTQLKVGSLCSRCSCPEGICSCHKHAVSVVNLPSLRKSRRTPGLDEISYDFMRASGAIAGFSQLRSVKGIKHDREKQGLSSNLSPAIAASLDTHGAVALLAASTRPRLIASTRKKSAKAHSSQEEVPVTQRATNWASSFDSGSNAQFTDEEYPRGGPLKTEEIPPVPPISIQSSLANKLTIQRGSITPEAVSGVKSYKLSAGECEEYMNMFASGKDSTELENMEDQEEDTLNNTDMTRPKRPYYCQKAQKFRTSWRTQSVETQSNVIDHGLAQDRSLTMVESQSDSESKSTGHGIGQERNAQVKVYLTRGSRNPVKTILVNHNANIVAANTDKLRARRQRTFSNRNQWRSVQLSPSHDPEMDRRAGERSYNASLCDSRESYVGYRFNRKPSYNHGIKKPLFWRNRSGSPFFSSLASTTDITKMRQLTKSSEAGPTSILKAQISHRPSEMKGDEDSTCLEPIFTIRQRRIQAMQRHRSNYTSHNVGYRLGRRKKMFQQRSLVSDYSLGFAILGILLMIVENELASANVITKDSIYSLLLKSLITCSTLVLIGLIVLYHIIVVRILSFDDSIEDWQIAWDRARVAKLVLEILVCAIHPVPGNFVFSWLSSYFLVGGQLILSCAHCMNITTNSSSFAISSTPQFSGSPHYIFSSNKVVPIDILLSLPMFLRLYLIFRVVVLHSKLFTDTGSRSIGAMNKVNFTTQFVFKTFMTICPGTVLVAFIIGFWAVLAWMLRACERVHDPGFENLLNSLWLVAVTFLSIGYGDVVANTYCGRAISIVTGVLGSLCTALVVAVFARRLELSKAEKHVIHFMMENTLTKKMKHYAANVLRETWLIYKYTKLVKKLNVSTIRKHQRKFLRAIHGLRKVKLEQRKLQDNANTLIDLAKTQSTINDTVSEMRIQHKRLQIQLDTIEESLLRIQEHFSTLPVILKYIQMQTHNSSGSNQKSEDPLGSEEGFVSHVPSHPYMRYRPHSSRILNHQGSTATTIRCDDSDLIIHSSTAQIPEIDRLEAAAQSAVSFESTQSHKPPSSARDCLDVEPVQRAVSEPPSSFPAAVRQG